MMSVSERTRAEEASARACGPSAVCVLRKRPSGWADQSGGPARPARQQLSMSLLSTYNSRDAMRAPGEEAGAAATGALVGDIH